MLVLVGVLTGLLNAVAYAQVAGTTEAERLAFARQMALFGKQVSYLLPAPVDLDTMGGYLTWRAFSTFGLTYAMWAVLAATGLGRGDEERGLTEHWLASGVSRARWLLTRAAGFAIVSLMVAIATVLVTAAGAAVVGDALPAEALVIEVVLLWALGLAVFGLGLLIAQLVVTRRAAGSLAAVTIIGLFVLNSASRSGLDAGAARWLSPFALFERSAPLLRGAPFDAAATLALVTSGALLALLALAAFVRRDIGGSVLGRPAAYATPTRAPSGDRLLRLPVLAIVDQQRWSTLGWSVSVAVLAYFMTSIARAIVDGIMAIPAMRAYLGRLGVAVYADFIGVIWFGTALFLLSALVVVQVHGWAADDAEGRLETVLAAGASRDRVVFERIAALLVSAGIVVAASSLVVFRSASAFGIAVDGDRVAVATALALTVVFAFAGVGHLLVGWRPRIAVVSLGAVAVISYLIQQFAPLFDAPVWVERLSIYSLYGAPMSKDEWGGAVALLTIGASGTIAAVAAMRRRDVGS